MMNCYLKIISPNKAKNDIDELMERDGFRNLSVHIGSKGKVSVFFSKLFVFLLYFIRMTYCLYSILLRNIIRLCVVSHT